jgi:hypothetical protein
MWAASTVAAFSIQNYRENAVRNAKSGIFNEKTLSSFISGQNVSTITVSDLFYSHKKYVWAFEKLLFDFESRRSGLPTNCDYPIKRTKLFAENIFQWQDSPPGKSSLYLMGWYPVNQNTEFQSDQHTYIELSKTKVRVKTFCIFGREWFFASFV